MCAVIRVSSALVSAMVLGLSMTATAEPGTVAIHAKLHPPEAQSSRDGRFGLDARLEPTRLVIDPSRLTLDANITAGAKSAGPSCIVVPELVFQNGFENP
jgi:hypothetical protein